MGKKIKLSASKIKTLDNCSWLYYSKYILKVPDISNDGASRGTIVHLIFEVLINPRHRKYATKLQEGAEVVASCEPVRRLIEKHAKRLNVNDDENLSLIYKMVATGLSFDFHCKGSKKLEAEKNFYIEGKDFVINGFIDKTATFKTKTKIVDYKSSKSKFGREELENNLQVLMYSLACYKLTSVIPEVSFLFLRFPRSPEQNAPVLQKDELTGFEQYLSGIAEFLSGFNTEDAEANFAVHGRNRWLCGSDKEHKWICPARKPFEYYTTVNKKGEITSSSFEKIKLNPKKGEKIKENSYEGCPHWNRVAEVDPDDPFNF